MPPAPANSNASSSNKRKHPSSNANSGRFQKRSKLQDARVISAQTADKAFSNGELNVAKFVKAREFEIKALEDGLKKSKHGLSTRAFQEVPKDLRRRTASHNVRRIPKRLRQRAAKEMLEDNTPTVTSRRRKPTPHQRLRLETAQRLQKLSSKSKKRRQEKKAQIIENANEVRVTSEQLGEVPVSNQGPTGIFAGAAIPTKVTTRKPKVKTSKLRSPAVPSAKFRKRQIHKTWLPTHLFHAKRAHMTPPKEPLWRFALPITPTSKSYRKTHRATTYRGAIAWDKSYVSTIGLEGPERSIEGLLKALGMGAETDTEVSWRKAGLKWRQGSRAWKGWLYERESWPLKGIAPVTVIWNAKDNLGGDAEREDLQASTSSQKKQKRKAFIRVHPAGFMQLWEQVIRLAKVQKPSVSVEDLRFEVGSIEIAGPNASEVLVAVLQPSVSHEDNGLSPHYMDGIWNMLPAHPPSSLPRHAALAFDVSDPRLRHPPRTIKQPESSTKFGHSLKLLADWPLDKAPRPASIFDRNCRLKACRSLSSQKSINRRKATAAPGEYPTPRATDPKIPVMLFPSRSYASSQGSWTILLPWKCVTPVWSSIMFYPLSTGGSVQFGGINEERQVSFESGIPWFPGDYPGTKAGDEWGSLEQAKRKAQWDRKPKGRRTEWESVDLGAGRRGEIGTGWACDWQRLIQGPQTAQDGAMEDAPLILQHLPTKVAQLLLTHASSFKPPTDSLVTVKITMITRGVPQTYARIYRLPTNNTELRKKWLAQIPTPGSRKSTSRNAPFPQRPPIDAPQALQRAYLAASILAAPSAQLGRADYPVVPDEEDLIGFVTTGNFNLGEGKGIGVGSLLLRKVMPPQIISDIDQDKNKADKEHWLCIVRDAGERIGRLARWEIV